MGKPQHILYRLTWKELDYELKAKVALVKQQNEMDHIIHQKALMNFHRKATTEYMPLYQDKEIESDLNQIEKIDIEAMKKQRDEENRKAQEFFFAKNKIEGE